MRRIGGTTFVVTALVFLASAVAFGASVIQAVRVGEVPGSAVDAPGHVSDPMEENDPALGPSTGENQEPVEETDSLPPVQPSDRSVRVAATSRTIRGGFQYPQVSNGELLQAVNGDLFQPDRTPPMERYLLPSEREASAPVSRNNRRRSEPDLRIVGTAIAGDLALAMVQPDDSIPFAVLLGETVDGFMLAAIDEESVTLTRDGDEFIYPVREPQRGRSSSNRDRNARDRAAVAEEAAQAMSERVQQMLRQLQQRGGGGAPGQSVQLRFTPNVDVIERGGQVGRGGTVTVRGRGGGGTGGGGSLP
jgi:hypothetical protein